MGNNFIRSGVAKRCSGIVSVCPLRLVGTRCLLFFGHTTDLIVNKKGKFTGAYVGLFDLFCWDNQSELMTEVGRDMEGEGADDEYKVCFPEQKVE